MKVKDQIFSFIESLTNAVKYNGWLFGIAFIYHSFRIKFLPNAPRDSGYKIFGLRFVYANRGSLATLLLENFGSNLYYFRTDAQAPNILDLGANIGDSMLYLKWLHPKAKIYSFEPNPKAFALLNKNVEFNNFQNDVKTYPYGVGLSDREIDFYDDATGGFNLGTADKAFISKIVNDANLPDKRINSLKAQIKRVSGFSEINALPVIDLVKIDIEGGEHEVIEDLKPLYPKIQRIILEYHMLADIKSNSFDDIVDTLRANGFTVEVTGFYRDVNNKTSPYAFMIGGYKNGK